MSNRRYQKTEYSPIVAELLSIIDADDGVRAVPALELPHLNGHSYIREHIRPGERNPVVRGFTRALIDAVYGTARPRMQRALLWLFAIARGSTKRDARQRSDDVVREGLVPMTYRKPRPPGRSLLHSELLKIESLMGDSAGSGPPGFTLEVPDIVPVVACDGKHDVRRFARIEFAPGVMADERGLSERPELHQALRDHVRSEAKRERMLFNDEPIVTVMDVEMAEISDGARVAYRLTAGRSSYLTWAATANILDMPLDDLAPDRVGTTAPTLRRHWNARPPQMLADLADVPAPAMVGICVAPVIGNRILLFSRVSHHVASVRSQGVDDATCIHVIGEGMQTRDVDEHGRLCATQAAARAVRQELSTIDADDFELIPTAVVVDQQRWQSVFCYVARYTGRESLAYLRSRAREASWEHVGGVADEELSVENPRLRRLLNGGDGTRYLASNHAHAAILYALLWREGLARLSAVTHQ